MRSLFGLSFALSLDQIDMLRVAIGRWRSTCPVTSQLAHSALAEDAVRQFLPFAATAPDPLTRSVRRRGEQTSSDDDCDDCRGGTFELHSRDRWDTTVFRTDR